MSLFAMIFNRRWMLALSFYISGAAIGYGQNVSSEQAKFFENEVRPLLAEKCFECHGEEDQSGGLRLDSLAWMLAGGESGDVLVLGEPESSVLIQAIRYEGYEMPPSGKLANEQIEVLTRWVKMGAPWPGEDPTSPVRKKNDFDDEDRSWWAIQPVVAPEVPVIDYTMSSWVKNDIDRFVVDRMTSQGLTPSPEADSVTLARRLYLDVTGLPPTPEEVASFVENKSSDAYEALVDRLLASKSYGEHAARQWLDLVRYADSDGYRADEYRPNAWRYRDYVIRSFNEDKRYDRFVQEQIAGDEMFPHDLDAQVALGYLRHWVYEWNIRDARTQWKTILEDVTDTTADVFLGLGLQCAKCHNHKFDPLLQKDYFRLQAFLAPIMPRETIVADEKQQIAYQKALASWEQQTAEIREKIYVIEQPYRDRYRDIAIDRFPDDLKSIARTPAAERTPDEEQLAYLVQRQVLAEYDRLDSYLSSADKESLIALRRQLKAFDSIKPAALPVAMAVTDVGAKAPKTVMPKRKDDVIDPGMISIMNPEALPIEPTTSGLTTGRRTALAKWITDEKNPLSTRVISNRIWQSHFGRGLAENPSDFGRLGGPPTHPELLDWLTVNFIKEGWSLKSLHRLILMSATYRQSTKHPQFAEQQKLDPANSFYWRRTTSRMTAEQIRDALLMVTGQFKGRSGGSGVPADSTYRTIYTNVMRNSPDQLLNSFDLPQFFASNSTRNTTTTPVQSLMLINSDLMLGHARKLAAAIEASSSDVEVQVREIWSRIYGRTPTSFELDASLRFLEQQTIAIAIEQQKTSAGLVATSKLPYRDGQAIRFQVDDPSLELSAASSKAMDVEDFTIETFFELRSIDKGGSVRTLVSKWDNRLETPGWRFGVTGAGSRRKPQTLVLQMIGEKAQGQFGEAAIFSDQHIAIDTPYYASASVQLASDQKPGKVTFYLKDLSNDDEPLLIAEVPHDVRGSFNNPLPLSIGSCGGSQIFDGLIDDVRFVAKALPVDEMLYSVERKVSSTIGFWQFEADPGVMQNSSHDGLHLSGRGKAIVDLTPGQAALADFCHLLLNSNEFLYVH